MDSFLTNSMFYMYLLFMHIIMSLLLGYVSLLIVKKRFVVKTRRVFYFMFLFNLSLPIIGYFATFWIAYYFKTVTYNKEVENISFLDLELFGTDFIEVQRRFGEGSIQDMMLNKYVPTTKKIQALVSMAENISQENVQIIKSTLSSSDDEVRLYSFAIIDKIERNINGKIYKFLRVYQETSDEQMKSKVAKDLAFLYWEMIYFELSEESLKNYLLREVKKYIQDAKIHYDDDIGLHILLGKVYMLEKNFISASSEFTIANKLSDHELHFVKSYVAEINFLTGHYRVVKNIINEAEDLGLNTKMYPITQQWKAS